MMLAVWAVALAAVFGPVQNPSVEVRSVAAERAPDVHLLLRAVDQDGTHIAGLTAANFAVFEDGRRVPEFQLRQSHPDSEPVAVSLLLDVSGSMSQADIAGAVAGARAVITRLAPEDKFEIVTFDSNLHHLKTFDQPYDATVLDTLRPGSDTRLNDAVAGALDRIAQVAASVRAVIVLSDGVDDGSATPPDVLLSRASASQAAVHAIGLGNVDATLLERLGASTGGSFQRAADGSELLGLYTTVASSLLTEYRLSFSSSLPEGPHQLTVVMTVDGQETSTTRDFHLGVRPVASESDRGIETYLLIGLVVLLLGALAGVGTLLVRRAGRDSGPVRSGGVAPLPPGVPVQSFHLVGRQGVFPISGRLVLGRDPLADVVVGDETVSRSHAQLEECEEGVLVQDLGSSNGTRVNGHLISVHVAQAGDLIAFGDLDFELRAPTA